MLEKQNTKHEPVQGRTTRMAHFFDKSHEGLIFHIDGTITDANPALSRMSGFTTDEIIGSNVFKWIPLRYHDLVKKNMARGSEEVYEIALTHKSGTEIPVYLRPVNALVDGKHERLVVVQEIYALKMAQQTQRQIEEKIHRLSNFDSQTGLPNLHLFNTRITEMCKKHQDEEQRFAIIHITVEHMKMYNEIFGRNIGDQLLNQWSTRLCNTLHDMVDHQSARISGIGFAVALPYIDDTNSVIDLLQSIRNKMEAPYYVEEHQVDNIDASYGIAFFPDNGNDTETLMTRAETACSHARHSTNDSIHCFSPEMNTHTLDKYKFEMRFKGALDRNELELYYQP
ncbi:MAG: sensor domain-containing diguanylate cyclase, partial [Gammaproteobacteria bacterium]|nr:sensor domain-containing diguanylate cyclase [Gammaproteobacteria bacterium]